MIYERIEEQFRCFKIYWIFLAVNEVFVCTLVLFLKQIIHSSFFGKKRKMQQNQEQEEYFTEQEHQRRVEEFGSKLLKSMHAALRRHSSSLL